MFIRNKAYLNQDRSKNLFSGGPSGSQGGGQSQLQKYFVVNSIKEKYLKNCVKYQENLIQQDLNEIILLKLKKLRKILKAKIRKNIENLWQKFEIIYQNYQNFIKISANFILKFIKVILKVSFTINLKYNASKDFWILHMYTYLFL